MQLALAACLDADREAIEYAVRVELGDDAAAEPAAAVEVDVACAPGGVDAGVVLEVRPPGSARRYRYALDWSAQPSDARPRLLGLAVAEAVDASRIELTALPEPPAAAPIASPAVVADARHGEAVAGIWAVSLVAGQRAFSHRAGVALVGGGLTATWRASPHARLAIDVLAETDTVLVASGAIHVQSLSAAPRAVLHVGGRLHAELGAGLRVGVVRMQGETTADTGLVGARLVRAWLGPIATAALGLDVAPRVAFGAGLEIGVAASGATGRELGREAAVLDGRWLALGLSATLTL